MKKKTDKVYKRIGQQTSLMTIGELKSLVQSIPAQFDNFEVGIFSANAIPRSPTIERVEGSAFKIGVDYCRGFKDANRAFLLRPEKEIV